MGKVRFAICHTRLALAFSPLQSPKNGEKKIPIPTCPHTATTSTHGHKTKPPQSTHIDRSDSPGDWSSSRALRVNVSKPLSQSSTSQVTLMLADVGIAALW